MTARGAGPVTPAPTPVPGPTPTPGTARPNLVVVQRAAAQQMVGEVQEFLVEITNTGQARATQLQVLTSYDRELQAVQLTDGFRWGANGPSGRSAYWIVDELPPGVTIHFQVIVRCVSPVARTCNRVTVTCAEQVRADDETCLQIVPAATSLSLRMTDLSDPIASGNDTTYEIRVTNNGQAPQQQVALTVLLPATMAPVVEESRGPPGVRVDVQQGVLRFTPVAEMRPGETLVYRVRCTARQPGEAVCRAQVTSTSSPQPITVQETTTVFAN